MTTWPPFDSAQGDQVVVSLIFTTIILWGLLLGQTSAEGTSPIRVVWGAVPQDADVEAVVETVKEIGFDVLAVKDPTAGLIEAAHSAGIRVFAVVTGHASREDARTHPNRVQAMLPLEEELAQKWRAHSWQQRTGGSFRWVPVFQDRPFLCFDDAEARSILLQRVEEALQTGVDGIFLDAFGYRNQYACFSLASRKRREALKQAHPTWSESEVVAQAGEDALVEISELLYDRIKSIEPDAIVMNHVWPPFTPNEMYASRLKLDFCSQTIAWFYPPVWPLDRVSLEAERIKRLEDPGRNRFMPFVGVHGDFPRPVDRIRKEVEIGLEHGEGSVVFARLRLLMAQPDLRAAVKGALSN